MDIHSAWSGKILPDVTFCGIQMSQMWRDLALWEIFFNTYRFEKLIEIGTFHGGMSAFLGMQCISRGVEFVTIDTQYNVDNPNFLNTLGVQRLRGDAFGQHHGVFFSDVPMCVFCDGGDKAREYRFASRILRPGDYIVVHDYGTEFTTPDFEATPKLPFSPDGSLTLFMVKV